MLWVMYHQKNCEKNSVKWSASLEDFDENLLKLKLQAFLYKDA